MLSKVSNAEQILSYLLSLLLSEFHVTGKEDSKNVYLKAYVSKNDFNFLNRNKMLLTSIKAIVMAYGAKINKKIHVDFVVKKQAG
ncbi:MAG: hypothetical protein ABDH21_04175 [bacterium]